MVTLPATGGGSAVPESFYSRIPPCKKELASDPSDIYKEGGGEESPPPVAHRFEKARG